MIFRIFFHVDLKITISFSRYDVQRYGSISSNFTCNIFVIYIHISNINVYYTTQCYYLYFLKELTIKNCMHWQSHSLRITIHKLIFDFLNFFFYSYHKNYSRSCFIYTFLFSSVYVCYYNTTNRFANV